MYPTIFTIAAVAAVSVSAHAADTAWLAGTDRLIVKYKDAVPAGKGAARAAPVSAQRQALVDRAGQQLGARLTLLRALGTGAHVFQLSRKVSIDEANALAAELMARDASVAYAEPDRILTTLATPTDPRYAEQWDLFESGGGLRISGAWDLATGAGINVAVIDTGYRPHADLAGQVLPGYDFIASSTVAGDGNGRDSDATDPGDWAAASQCGAGMPAADQSSSWHGTHVAGTIAAKANNGIGVAGVAYNAKIVPVRVLGKCGGYTSDIADGIIWSSGGLLFGVTMNPNKARVLNLSLGGGGSCAATMQTAINGARSRGAVVVVAAGNAAMDASNFTPANCAGVITVAATNRSGARASYSNVGSIVDVAAPGGDASAGILSTLNGGTRAPAGDAYASYSGTSMAAPHVAGVVALMLSKNPALTPDQVDVVLKSSARAFPAACSGCGAGIVDATAALSASATIAPVTLLAELEPNDTIAAANPVAVSGTIVNGALGSGTDADYFRIAVPAGKQLGATMTPGPSAPDYDLYLYDSAGALRSSSENGSGAVESVMVRNSGSAAAIYYVGVRYYSGASGAKNGKYALQLIW
ncbi:S8 family peptidase [Massilia sp. S19_KUP03_FR1]|uniref:S8 family peptidase n=1 Tax=Massilia sp. S19_KUP03_FR1 TaxID=3025503 RepID=UPI002FCD7CD5